MNIKEFFSELISPIKAAELTGLGERTVRQAIENKMLVEGEDCIKIGRQWVIYKPSLCKLNSIRPRRK